MYPNKADLWLGTMSLPMIISLCIGIHSIPHRTHSYESCLSKQFNVNTVILCGLCLSGYSGSRQRRSLLLWSLLAKALWHPPNLPLKSWSMAGQHPCIFFISVSRPTWCQATNTLQSYVFFLELVRYVCVLGAQVTMTLNSKACLVLYKMHHTLFTVTFQSHKMIQVAEYTHNKKTNKLLFNWAIKFLTDSLRKCMRATGWEVWET